MKNNIKKIRELKGLKQQDLARILKISNKDYILKENGKKNFTFNEYWYLLQLFFNI